ncbi:hypothetical protein GCM10008959_04290 [Deinococcus seoulensis]|uniref:DUF4083 domain-containing protein n=2 Tax=Deinococcus TaxID=1298 RepID=A0ABQ2RL81_9DEIO|nr:MULTISPECIES: hypothetical protein [Deinococcus]GGR46426.1 hypothetical protein GCM10008959_04290 [Deinococcus seoulensis]GGS14798.1 hypothetical protein GCM10008961_02600 [Deinococcus knuensis]
MPPLGLPDLLLLLTVLSVIVGLIALIRFVVRHAGERSERSRLHDLERRIQQLERERLH